MPDLATAAVFGAVVLSASIWLVATGTSLTHEDGFYYFRIAQHVASGHGSTFDGQHLTNGYHPLWMLLLVPLFWLAPSADGALTAGLLVQVGLSAVAVTLVYYTARLLMGRVGAVIAAQLWLVFTASVTLGGQEFALHAVGVLATAYLIFARGRTSGACRSPPTGRSGCSSRLPRWRVWRVVGSWNAGAIGFLSGRDVVNLDGLVNSWDYVRHDRHDLCRYWSKAGISYIVDMFEGARPVTPVPRAWSRDACVDRMQPLLVDDRYQASWRIEAYFVGDGP